LLTSVIESSEVAAAIPLLLTPVNSLEFPIATTIVRQFGGVPRHSIGEEADDVSAQTMQLDITKKTRQCKE